VVWNSPYHRSFHPFSRGNTLMTNTQERRATNGMWKFALSQEEVILIAEELRDSTDGPHYESLVVRSCSRSQWAIWFVYKHSHPTSIEHRRYFEAMTDMFKRRWGNGFAGYDVTDTMWVVK
jgi:hypothetical protein